MNQQQPPGYPPTGHYPAPQYQQQPAPQYQQYPQGQSVNPLAALDLNALAALQGLAESDATAKAFGEDRVPRVSIKGRVFRLIVNGTEIYQNMNPMDFIIVSAAPAVSRAWYAAGYMEGSKEAPVCSSQNGVVPDTDAPQPQFSNCAQCPHNREGSGQNGRGRACRFSQLIAVCLPDKLYEEENNIYSMRIPAVSLFSSEPAQGLYGLQGYASMLKKSRSVVSQVVTNFSWNPNETLALWFRPSRVLTPAEYQRVLQLQQREDVHRAINITESGTLLPTLPAPAQMVPQSLQPMPSYGAETTYVPPVHQPVPQQPVYTAPPPAHPYPPVQQHPAYQPSVQPPPQQSVGQHPHAQQFVQPPPQQSVGQHPHAQQFVQPAAQQPIGGYVGQTSLFDQPQVVDVPPTTPPVSGLTRPAKSRGRGKAPTETAGQQEIDVPPPIVHTSAPPAMSNSDEDLASLVASWSTPPAQ